MEFSDDAEETFKNALALLQVRFHQRIHKENSFKFTGNYRCTVHASVGSRLFCTNV